MCSAKMSSWCANSASSDKHIWVNWSVYGKLHWLENIIKKWLLCLRAALYASLYAAARSHCTAWGCPVILPRRSFMKPPVQESERFWRFPRWAQQRRGEPALPGHAGMGREVIPCDTTNANYNAWCACLNRLLFCCMTHPILYKHLNNFYICLNEI